MSRFYGTVRGKAESEAGRGGSERSGLRAHVRGWDVGFVVICQVDSAGHDMVCVYVTGGSNNPRAGLEVARVFDMGEGRRLVQVFDESGEPLTVEDTARVEAAAVVL